MDILYKLFVGLVVTLVGLAVLVGGARTVQHFHSYKAGCDARGWNWHYITLNCTDLDGNVR